MRRFWPRIEIKVGERFRKESLMIAIWCNANLKTSNCIYSRSRALPLNQHPSTPQRNVNRNCRSLSDSISSSFLASYRFRDCYIFGVVNAWPIQRITKLPRDTVQNQPEVSNFLKPVLVPKKSGNFC